MASSHHPDGQATASAKDVAGDNTPPDNVTDIAQARRVKKTAASSGNKSPDAKSSAKPVAKKAKTTSNRRFDHEKVANIKEAIANGTYTIDAQRIADKFIEKESP